MANFGLFWFIEFQKLHEIAQNYKVQFNYIFKYGFSPILKFWVSPNGLKQPKMDHFGLFWFIEFQKLQEIAQNY